MGRKRDFSTAETINPSIIETQISKDPNIHDQRNAILDKQMTNIDQANMSQGRRDTVAPDNNSQHDHDKSEQNSLIPFRDKSGSKLSYNGGIQSFMAMHQKKETKSLTKSYPLDHTVKSSHVNGDTDSGLRNEWVAPEDQDGTGFTKLNEKYLGRY